MAAFEVITEVDREVEIAGVKGELRAMHQRSDCVLSHNW